MDSQQIHRGLEGVTVTETDLSDIDGANGELFIAGFPVGELATNATYEETLFLLLNDRLPTEAEYESFRDELATRRGITDETRALLERAVTEEEPPMDALRMGLGAATLGDDATAPEQKAKRAIAVVPTIVATYWRYRQGAEPVDPDPGLGHAANYLYMLNDDEPDAASVRGLETYLNTVVDHGLNASTFTARVVVSTESDVISAATAAVGTLKGPLHGGAPGPVLDMLQEVHESGEPESYVRDTLEAGERLMGFGHRVYDVRDPRAAVLSTAAEQFYDEAGDSAFFETVTTFERTAADVLAQERPDLSLETNVEYYTAALLNGVGIPRDLFTTTFAAARVGGWMAHALEQLADNRIIRPRGRYAGTHDRTWTPRAER
ncbi:citrate synthase [Halovenus aranensis]|uniref:Citrate synthase n=1 Tax=Halovenus aranensis TaxID=890420 RepID=A0A1G8TR42_9EURY|nr:citrate/2-methylcitrate synthase [Halovenus aranensis]SDJ43991.1 citrate synthase [Halovenus aranensis]